MELKKQKTDLCEVEDLDKVAGHLNEEVRMVLPGIQTILGFQLIAVFNERFQELRPLDQGLHFCALLCSAFAVMLVLIPAAYHRQVEPYTISKFYCQLGNRVLTYSLFPMAVGTSMDLYVIADMVFDNTFAATSFGLTSFLLFMTAWYLFPQRRKHRSRNKNIH